MAADAFDAAFTPRAAAHWLAALCGFEPEHFTYRDQARDKARHGPLALLARCRFVDLGGTDRPADLPDLGRDAIRIYQSGAWGEHLLGFHATYLAGGRRELHSPLHGCPVPILGEVVMGASQIYVAQHGNELFFFIFVGRIPQGLYHPGRNLFLVLHPFPLRHEDTLSSFLQMLLGHPLPFALFVMRAMRGELRPGFVLGDMRPGHFVKESLGYVDSAEAALHAFLDGGGLLAMVADWCAMHPLDVFPALRRADLLVLNGARAGLRMVEMGIDAHRVYRIKTRRGSLWLRRRLGVAAERPAAPAARFRVMISLDAERQRILNQVEAFRFVLRRLGAACARAGLALEVVWDGWTMPHLPNEKDRVVMARIEALIAEITADLGVEIAAQHRVFGRSFTAKIPDIATCDLVFVTQGTGALMPSWLLERPTITYHVAALVHNRTDLAGHSVFQVDQRAILEKPAEGPRGDLYFAIALWGLDDALVRAVGARLGLERELPAPDDSQTTTKAGTA